MLAMLCQAIIIVLYGIFVRFDETSLTANPEKVQLQVTKVYPFFQDVHVMIYVGFGFLMCFIKTHCWTSIGYNFIIAAFSFQLAILWLSFFHQVRHGHHLTDVFINLESLIAADFCAAAVLITFGAILGRVSI